MLADVDNRLQHDPRQRDSERSIVNPVNKAQDVLCRWIEGVIAYRLRTERQQVGLISTRSHEIISFVLFELKLTEKVG